MVTATVSPMISKPVLTFLSLPIPPEAVPGEGGSPSTLTDGRAPGKYASIKPQAGLTPG